MGKHLLVLLFLMASLRVFADPSAQVIYTYAASYRRPVDEKRPLTSQWRKGSVEFQVVVLPDQTFWILVDKDRYLTSISPIDQKPYFFDLKEGTRSLIDRSKDAAAEVKYYKPENGLILYLASQKQLARPIEMFFAYKFETEGFPAALSRLLGIPGMPERTEILEFFSRYAHKAMPLHKVGYKSKTIGNVFKDDVAELWKFPVVPGDCTDYACGQHHKGDPRENTFKPKPEDII